jgi:hypothetical protein
MAIKLVVPGTPSSLLTLEALMLPLFLMLTRLSISKKMEQPLLITMESQRMPNIMEPLPLTFLLVSHIRFTVVVPSWASMALSMLILPWNLLLISQN